MGFLTKEQIKEVWEDRGLEGHVRRMHEYLVANGLLPLSVPDYVFIENFRQRVLENFFLKGVTEDEHGRQTYPSERD